MTQQEILEGNKLIAEFIGYEHDELEENEDPTITYNCYDHLVNLSGVEAWESSVDDWTNWLRPDEMLFRSSWDWLIPIINKIYESDWYYKWKDTSGQFEKEVFINTKFIETTWEQVVEFIKWYNENKNK